MKRVLGILLSTLMVLMLVVPVLAYDTPNAEAVNGNWPCYRFRLDGSSAAASYGASFAALSTKNYVLSNTSSTVTYENGAMHLVNSSTTNTNYVGSTSGPNWALGTSPNNMLFDNAAGSTIDFAAKFDNLPRIGAAYMGDEGVLRDQEPSAMGILFGGFVVQMICPGPNVNDPTHFKNEIQGVFVLYDNATLGTNAAFMLNDTLRTGSSWASGNVYTWFFNIPEDATTGLRDFARYTIRFDAVNKTTNFYVNGVNQDCYYYDTTLGAYTSVATLGTVASYYRTTDAANTGNALNLCLNGPAHNATKGDSPAMGGNCYCDVTIDQFDIYNAAGTPVGTSLGTFVEPQIVDTSSADHAAAVINDLHESYYTAASWAALENAVQDYENETELTEVTVYNHKNAIVSAVNALEFLETDKLYIGHTSSSTNPASGWTNDSLLFTETGYCLTDYSVNAMTLGNWTRIVALPIIGHTGMYRISAIYSEGTAVSAAETVPEGGFILAMHLEGRDMTAGGSQYASQEFGNRNIAAFDAMGLATGDVVLLNNVEYSAAGDSTLSTTGTWVHRYANPAPVPSAIWRESSDANPNAVEGGPQYLAKDQFDGFVSNSYLSRGEELPNFIVTVEGSGTVNATVKGIGSVIDENNPGKYSLLTGDSVALEAVGEEFAYWKNAKNGAVISTQPALSLSFALSTMELIAVFQSESGSTTQYPVTFKNGLTGKIIKVVDVDADSTVPAAEIPAMSDIYGYTFAGWYADNLDENPIATYAIDKATTFVARFDKNESDNLSVLTVVDGDESQTYQRRYSSIMAITAAGSNFAYWDLDGVSVSSLSTLRFGMPNRDCTLTAVYEDLGTLAPSTAMISCFVDEGGTMLITMSRDLPAGNTLVESGVLMTRKAGPDDLFVNTIANVTRGVSSTTADRTAFGFQKTNMFAKNGTWYVRGYLSYHDANGDLQTTYTPVYVLDVPDTANAQSVIGVPYTTDVSFTLFGEYDSYFVDTYPHQEESSSTINCFFPTVTQADDGTIIVVYYYSPVHAYYNTSEGPLQGVLKMVKSTDHGETWTEPETIVDLTVATNGKRESRDPNLQKLADGTIVLTFPVRTSLDVAGMNGSASNDYWYERAYYMTSTDNGQTWSEINLIPCNYFSTISREDAIDANGNHKNAAGCWVKNGSMAELPNGDLLIPLYGATDCSTRAILQSVVVKAHNNGDGTLSFYDTWANGTDAVPVTAIGGGDELALHYYGGVVYGALRVKVANSAPQTPGGTIIRSTDNGETFSDFTYETTINNCLNQPNFLDLGDGKVLFNYAVPRSSAPLFETNAKGTGRPVFGKVLDMDLIASQGASAWDHYDALMVYDGQGSRLTNDMGNPCSILMDNGEILTVFYNNSKPSFIGARITTLFDYTGDIESGSGSGSGVGATLMDLDFEDMTLNSVYPTNGTSGDVINDVLSGGKINRARDTDNGGTYGHAELRVSGDAGDQYLEFYTNNQKRSACATNKVLIAGDKGDSVIVSFDYNFGNNVTVDGEYHKIEMRPFDSKNAVTRDTTTLGIKATPGAVSLLNGSTVLETASLSASVNTWYTVKVLYQGGKAAYKVFARGASEPDWSTAYEVNAATATAAEAGNPIGIACWARGTAQTTAQVNSIYIDNVTAVEAQFGFGALYPVTGAKLSVGKSASIRVVMNSVLPITGNQVYSAYCDNPAVAALSSTGVVTAIGVGKANVHVLADGVDHVFPIFVS